MVTSQHDVFIRFHSDFGNNGYGFRAKYFKFAGNAPYLSPLIFEQTFVKTNV